jgi:hypothetical protein
MGSAKPRCKWKEAGALARGEDAHRLETAVDLISSRGALAFRTGDQFARQQFEELVSSAWKPPIKKPEPVA